MSPEKINRITVLLLALGLGSALAIYLTAQPFAFDPLLGDPLANKKYMHELQVMGGKGNVIVIEFMEWFKSLWRGQALAATVAVLTVVTTFAFRLVAALPDPTAPGLPAEKSLPSRRS